MDFCSTMQRQGTVLTNFKLDLEAATCATRMTSDEDQLTGLVSETQENTELHDISKQCKVFLRGCSAALSLHQAKEVLLSASSRLRSRRSQIRSFSSRHCCTHDGCLLVQREPDEPVRKQNPGHLLHGQEGRNVKLTVDHEECTNQ